MKLLHFKNYGNQVINHKKNNSQLFYWKMTQIAILYILSFLL
jgi:hypothetical protein